MPERSFGFTLFIRACERKTGIRWVHTGKTHEDMAREAETRASFYRTLASLYFKELDQAGIDALSNEDLTATGVDDELMEEGYADMAAYLKHRDGGTRQELATDFAGAILAAGSYDDRRATPYESVFTSESGLLMQEARDDVYRRFCEARVAVDEGLRTRRSPEFRVRVHGCSGRRAARALHAGDTAAAASALRTQREFHRDHLLNWIDAYCDCLQSCAQTRFYRGVAKLTRGFVHMDEDMMDDAAETLC